MKVLVVNCGSSSLKYQLMDTVTEEVFALGICERIGIHGGIFKYETPGNDYEEKNKVDMPTHKEALELVLKAISGEHGVVKTLDEVEAIGHRIVHGGEYFDDSALVTDDVMEKIEELCALAPLHNPAHLIGIRTCQELLPGKPNVVTFDTAFHQTMPGKAYMYALPYADYSELKVRKYGFHGTSHYFVSKVGREILGKEDAKIVVCHLGNGASVTAVNAGKSVDTSMGLTPLQGLMMGTRCGDIDPAAVLFVKNKRGLSDKEMDSRMNKESGLLGIFEESSDCRDVENAMVSGDERAKLAMEMFGYRVRAYIASYAAAMGGIDMIAFTGGIGENSDVIRAMACEGLEFMGVEMDTEVNSVRKKGNVKLSKDSSKVAIYKIPTNEELVIAQDTYRIVSGK